MSEILSEIVRNLLKSRPNISRPKFLRPNFFVINVQQFKNKKDLERLRKIAMDRNEWLQFIQIIYDATKEEKNTSLIFFQCEIALIYIYISSKPSLSKISYVTGNIWRTVKTYRRKIKLRISSTCFIHYNLLHIFHT